MSHEVIENDTLAEAYQTLNAASRDEHLNALIEGEGPLELTELDEDIRQSEAFEQFVEEYGWPTASEDGQITPAPQFKDDDQFLDAFTHRTKVDNRVYYLNNFKVWIAAEPNTERFSEARQLYGAAPALLRAYIIAPEFMEAVRVAYTSLPKEAYYPSAKTLDSPEGELVVHGAHMAYKLLGRLIKTDDRRTHAKILFGKDSTSGEPIDDAATYLAE